MKKIITTILTLAIILGCSGCQADTEIMEFSEAPSSLTLEIRKTENGYYFTDIMGFGTSGLKYYDSESRLAVPLCNKPECDHNNDGCIAGNPDSAFAVCGDYIYFVSTDLTEDDAVNIEVALQKVACDGSSRTKLATLYSAKFPKGTGGSLSYSQMLMHKGKLYFTYDITFGEKSSSSMGIGEYDFSSGKVKDVLVHIGDSFDGGCLVGVGDYVYFRYNEDIMKYDPKTEKLEMIFDDKCLVLRSDGENLYSYCGGYMWKINPETMEEKLIYKGRNHMINSTIAAYDGYAIVYKSEDGGGFDIIDEDGTTVLGMFIEPLIEEAGFEPYEIPFFEIGADENGEFIIHTAAVKNDAAYNLVLGCSFEGLINGTEKPKLIFAAEIG